MTLRFGKLPKTTVRHWLSCQQQWKYPSTRTISDLPSSSPLPPHLTLCFCLVFVSVSVSVSVSVFTSISSPVCDLRFTSFVFSLLDAKWVLYHIVIYCYMLRWCDRLCTEISDLLAVALGCTLEAGLGSSGSLKVSLPPFNTVLLAKTWSENLHLSSQMCFKITQQRTVLSKMIKNHTCNLIKGFSRL